MNKHNQHDHEHDHRHEHEHDHEHGAACACDDCGCDCGHEHGGTHSNREYWLIGGAVALFGVSFLPALAGLSPFLLVAATLLAGAELFWKGIKAGLRLSLDELFLMTVAVVAAVAIGEYSEAALVTILFRVGELLEDLAISRSKREIAALTAIRPDSANLQTASGTFEAVAAVGIPIGSVIQLRPGERVPLDCVVLEGVSTADCASITGESVPVEAHEGTALPSSAINGAGLLICRTTRDFANSSASRIIALVEESAAKKGATENFITRFSKIYTPIIIVLAAALAIIPPLLGFGEWQVWLSRSLVFLVASCPCALVISVPLSFFAGVGAASKRGVIIKGSKYIERLARVDCAVFDKTGTLTGGKLSIAGVVAANDYAEDEVLHIASAAEQDSNHPIARAIAAYHATLPAHAAHQVGSFAEISGHGVSLLLDGKTVLCGSKRFLNESGVDTGALDGLSVYVASDGVAAGGIEISDLPRVDTASTLRNLKALGVKQTVMLTGDNVKNAERVAAETGVDRCFAGLLPENKVERLEECKAEFGVTMFVGDGINDAPVLAAADIGVAMGLGTDAAIEAADVVLVSDRLSALTDAVTISRRTMSIARFNIAFALSIKAIVLVLGALGFAQMWMAVFADVGVSILAVANAARILAGHK